VRWVDRGRGNIYEAREDDLGVATLSNTVLPRMYSSAWNKNLTAFIGSILESADSIPSTVYAALIPVKSQKTGASSTAAMPVSNSSVTPFSLQGKNLSGNVVAYAESPKKDKVFLLMDTGSGSTGYVASFDGSGMTQIFSTPLTQINVDWPSDNIIAINTKGAADQGGFLYFVNPATGVWTKVVGPLPGLSAKVSHDGKYVLLSAAGDSNNILTSVYNVQKGTGLDTGIRTIADKCAWGNFYKDLVYCGVPSQPASAEYPDDWYKGNVSFSDKIWQVSASTGEVHMISSIVDQSDRLIDAFTLGLDPKDNYLFFMNKKDLSFWSLDLVNTKQ
jgi:hypothetical protein